MGEGVAEKIRRSQRVKGVQIVWGLKAILRTLGFSVKCGAFGMPGTAACHVALERDL